MDYKSSEREETKRHGLLKESCQRIPYGKRGKILKQKLCKENVISLIVIDEKRLHGTGVSKEWTTRGYQKLLQYVNHLIKQRDGGRRKNSRKVRRYHEEDQYKEEEAFHRKLWKRKNKNIFGRRKLSSLGKILKKKSFPNYGRCTSSVRRAYHQWYAKQVQKDTVKSKITLMCQ